MLLTSSNLTITMGSHNFVNQAIKEQTDNQVCQTNSSTTILPNHSSEHTKE